MKFLVMWRDLSGNERFSLIGYKRRISLIQGFHLNAVRSQLVRLTPVGEFESEKDASLFLESSGKVLSELPPAREMSRTAYIDDEEWLKRTKWLLEFEVDPLEETEEELKKDFGEGYRSGPQV